VLHGGRDVLGADVAFGEVFFVHVASLVWGLNIVG
jgi:hypothetical protein